MRLTRLVIAALVLGPITGLGVYISLQLIRYSSTGPLEVDRAAAREIDRRRAAARLQPPTAELLPPLPEPPPELLAPLERTPVPLTAPLDQPPTAVRLDQPPTALPQPIEP